MFNPIFMRSVAQIVLIVFTATTLQQSALAAGTGQDGTKKPSATHHKTKVSTVKRVKRVKSKTSPAKSIKGKRSIPVATPIVAPKPAGPSQAGRYGRGLEHLRELGERAQAKQARGERTDDEVKQMRALEHDLDAMEADLDAEFTATDKHIKDHKLPPVIFARNQAALKQFKTNQAELKQRLKAFDEADDAHDDKQRGQKLRELSDYLKVEQKPEVRMAADPKKLPFGAPDGKARTPRKSEREYRASLFKVWPVMLAGPIPNGFTMPATALPATPTPDDLAPTEDIVLTPAIKAQAAALNNNPVQIYNWVRNNIEYLPTYGSIQGADMTLQSKRGNDIDSASLLIALLRAAGIPARYVYGTIRVPGNRAANWLGGVATPDAALRLLGQGGVPSMSVTSGGMTTAIDLEHVWVKAWVDYTPSRGAINKNPDTWVVMDPSFKQYSETPGLNLQGAVSLNGQGVLDGAKQGATCTADYAQMLNTGNLQAAYTGYKTQLATYLGQQGANLTVGDVLGTRKILPENYPILLGTLPYTTVAVGGEFALLPSALRWQFNYTLYAGAMERAQGLSTLSYSASLPNLAGKRVNLSFTPATAADAATLASYLPQPHANGTPILASEFPASLPAYLINVKAELRVDGQAVAVGGSFTLGSPLIGTAGLLVPASGAWDNRDHGVNAGEFQAIALDGQGIAASQMDDLKTRAISVDSALAAGQYAALTRDDVTGLLLQQTAMGYLALTDANTAIYQRASGMVDVRLPSHIRAIARVEPQYALGIIVSATFPGVRLGIDRYAHAAVSKQNLATSAYNRQGMERASAYVHLALENLFTDALHPGQGDSAVKALAAANSQSQPIRLINAANAATIAPQLQMDAATIADIQNAAAAGKLILAQNGILASGGWSGSGYIIEDTATGAGNYLLTAPTHGVLYPTGGAGWPVLNGAAWPAGTAWLALASPTQSGASVAYAFSNGIAFDGVVSSVLNGMDGTRWQYFPARDDVMNGLFLSNLNAIQPASACDSVAAIIASGLGASTGISNANAASAVNHPPVIQSNPAANGATGQAYRYALLATDPDGDKLAYSIVAGPTGMKIDALTGVVTWAAPLEGSYNVTLRADDGRAYTDQNYTLVIGKGAMQLDLTLVVTPAVAATTGASVTISVVTMGGQGTVTRSLTVDGAAVALDATGKAVISAGAMGVHPIVATATDGVTPLTRQDVYSVSNPADTTPPTVAITSPLQDASVTAPVDIIGTASDANLAYYKIVLTPAGAAATASMEISRGFASVTNGKLGSLDPTVLANGLYDLSVIAADANGQQTTATIGIEIYRDLKIGQFSLTYTDLDVNASGIPIRVTRTYDTRKKMGSYDFGYGWTVGYQDVQLRKNEKTGLDWNVVAHPMQLTICLLPGRNHKISVLLPTGKLERFSARNAQDCATAQIPPVNIVFDAQPGTTSTLELATPPWLLAQGGELIDMNAYGTWDPTDFKLTTAEGYIYYITEGIGITSIVDPYGNTLTYGPNGITHSDGQGVAFTRDSQGRITTITDPSGKVIKYAYDVNGNLSTVTNRNNEASSYAYNREHGLTSYTAPSGTPLARYSYDAQGRLVSVTDANGQAIQATHDTANNQDIVKDRLGRTTTYVYDTNGDVTKIIDPLGGTTLYAYDSLGDEVQVTDPLGNITKRTFDPATGRQLSETDPMGGTTSSSYFLGKLSQTIDANGNVTKYAYFPLATTIAGPTTGVYMGYDDRGNLNRFGAGNTYTTYSNDAYGNHITEGNTVAGIYRTFDANGRELTRTTQRTDTTGVKVSVSTSQTYDAEGRVITETDALGGVTKTVYNSANKPTQVTDPAGRVTAYTYDAQARLIKTTYPDGTSDSTKFDAEGNQTATMDRAGRTTQYTYDGKNRLTKTIYPDGTADTSTYDAAGRTDSTRDANGNPVTNRYDGAGRLIASTDALGHITSYTYDPNGNRLRMTDANGQITSYAYDGGNRLIKTTYPDGTTRSLTYNASGKKTSETDQNGNTVTYGYDVLVRINQATLTTAAGATAVTGYGYDEQDNKVSQTDALGRITKWAYDNANRVTSRTLPNGETETFAYDAVGNRIAHTDFKGLKTSYTVDSNGRVVFATDSTGKTTGYLYTASGQISAVSDSRGATKYTYDARDRLTRQDNPDGSYLAYAYDANGNVTQRSTPAGTTTYAYDNLNRLITVTGLDGKQTGYAYDANGNRIKTTLPNGTETAYTYDALNRLTSVEHRQSASGSVLRGYAYTLRVNGQRSQVREYDAAGTIRTRAYTYDGLNRLTQDILADSRTPANSNTTSYVYGNTGNRMSKTEVQNGVTTSTSYVYDADDRLTSETKTQGTTSTTISYAWDTNGNLLQKIEPTQTTLYTWDGNNRLVEVKRGTSAATATSVATYTYDANGNRVGKTTAAGQSITYLVDNNQPYAQVAQETATTAGATATTTTTNYLYGLERIQMTRGGQGTYYHDDGLGSTRLLTDQTGAVTDSYDYDDYGALQAQTGTTQNSFLYAGEQFDPEANLYYNRARYLDTNTGRFTGLDPYAGNLSQPITLNKYTYANGDPVNVVDPSGRFGLTDTAVATNIANTLSSIQTDVGMNLLDAAMNPNAGNSNTILLGAAMLGGVAAFKMLRMLSSKFRRLNLPEVKQVDMAHVTGAHMTGAGKVTGYHLRPGGFDFPGWSVSAPTRGPNKDGVYEALVYFNGKAKKKNDGMSTFFPDSWDEARTEAEILSAFLNSKGGSQWRGISASGIPIKGSFDNGIITSAFPELL